MSFPACLVLCYHIYMVDKEEKRVFATVLTRDASGRAVLSGMLDYLSGGIEWNLHLLQTRAEVTAAAIGEALAAGADGFLLTISGAPDAYAALAASHVPVVCVGLRDRILLEREGPTRFVWNDNAAIGRLAADYFTSADAYASFAFLGETRFEWSRGRELGWSCPSPPRFSRRRTIWPRRRSPRRAASASPFPKISRSSAWTTPAGKSAASASPASCRATGRWAMPPRRRLTS